MKTDNNDSISVRGAALRSEALAAPAAQLVWMFLMRQCADSPTVETTIGRIASATGMNEKNVRTTLASLAESGLLTDLSDGNGARRRLRMEGVRICAECIFEPLPVPVLRADTEIDWERFRDFFNRMVEGTEIPAVRTITDTRRRAVTARMKEHHISKDRIAEAIRRVAASDFLTGRNGAWSHCHFDWIFKKQNFQKIMEGTYDNRYNETSCRASGRGQHRNPTALDIARGILSGT